MAEPILAGAAVGAVFGELLKVVLDAKDKALVFKPTLAYLTRTLKAIDPLIKQIEQHNNNLGRPKEELESLIKDMEEGTKLVYKCSKISRINIYGRLHYQEELIALAGSMERFFKIDMQVQIARDLKETLSKVGRIYSAVNKLPFLGAGSSSANNSATEAVVNLSQREIHEPADENATMEINSIEETVDSDTLRSTPCKDADRITSAEQVMEDINSFSQKTEAKAHSQATEQLEPPSVYCIPCGTSIRQNATLNTSGLAKTSYSYCNQCCNERIPGKITAYKGYPCKFDLEDLLSASAEVLGKTSYGTTYKVMLKKNGTLVMKRLKDVVVQKKEFERRIKFVQNISQHPNVMPLLAWYYSKHEKLLIYDYMPAGSLCRLLHGTTGEVSEFSLGWTPLDFSTRMKILLGAAKGIAHTHSVMGGKFVHGNINSCNVLVTDDFQGRISDFCLTCSVSESFDCFEKEGYQAPEIKLTQKADVYNFGIILLEMLTRSLPSCDLPNWIQHQAMDGLLGALVDPEIHDNKYAGDMMQLARECVARKPHRRPSMSEVVMRMEEIYSIQI